MEHNRQISMILISFDPSRGSCDKAKIKRGIAYQRLFYKSVSICTSLLGEKTGELRRQYLLKLVGINS